jgi:hypothetical protein
MAKRKLWIQTDLGYAATKDKLLYDRRFLGDSSSDYEGKLSFSFKDLKDITFQITTRGKIGIFYPEGVNPQVALERLKPYLVKADGSPASIKHLIDEKPLEKPKSFGFLTALLKCLEKKEAKKRLEESRVFKPQCLPMVEEIAQDFGYEWLKPFIEHDKEINKKLEQLENKD